MSCWLLTSEHQQLVLLKNSHYTKIKPECEKHICDRVVIEQQPRRKHGCCGARLQNIQSSILQQKKKKDQTNWCDTIFFPEFSSFPEERLELSGGRSDVGGQADEFDVSKVAVPPAGYCEQSCRVCQLMRAVTVPLSPPLWRANENGNTARGGNSHTSPQTLWLFAVQALQILALVSARLWNPSQTDGSDFPPGINVCLHSHILWPCFYWVCPMWLDLITSGQTRVQGKTRLGHKIKECDFKGFMEIGNSNLCFVLVYQLDALILGNVRHF